MLDRRYHNRELQMMKVMEHDNVVRLRHFFDKPGRKRDETFLYLVMDYLPETIRSVALKHHKRAKRFHVDHIRAYLAQTFKALEYIHARRICHRDIKPDNLLCDPASLKCRLCDFGCSKVLVKGQPNVSYICSRYYRAPELMFGATEYSVSVDVWSVGTILMELLLGHLPFQGQDSTQQHLVEIMKLLGTPTDRDLLAMRATCCADDLPKLKPYPWERVFPASTAAEAVDLAQRLLRYDPDERLTASMALAHPFFDGVDQLVDGNCVIGGALHPAAIEPAANRTPLLEGEWDARVGRFFTEMGAFDEFLAVEVTEKALQGVVAQVVESFSRGKLDDEDISVSQMLKRALRQRDVTIGSLFTAMVEQAGQHSLPFEGHGAMAGAMAGATRPASQGALNAAMIPAEMSRLQVEKHALSAELSARDDLRAKVADLKLRGHFSESSAECVESVTGSTAECVEADGSRATPGFGRRAPVARPMPLDNLGQMTPFGASSASPDTNERAVSRYAR